MAYKESRVPEKWADFIVSEEIIGISVDIENAITALLQHLKGASYYSGI